MVFFVCNVCGENLKKNQVEKHISRRCNSFSCHDCGRDFSDVTYAQHTKCVSEEQKYYGSDYKPKSGANKGEQKQESWTEHVNAAIQQASGNPRLKAVLVQVAGHPNVPRKKAKFVNFLKNSLRVYDSRLVDEAWSVIEKNDKSAANSVATANGHNAAQTDSNGHTTENGSRKRKAEREESGQNGSGDKTARLASENDANDETTNSVEETAKPQKFKWNRVFQSILNEKDVISIKKLKKAVRKQYKASAAGEFDSESFSQKFAAHLDALVKSAKVQLDGDNQSVRLSAL